MKHVYETIEDDKSSFVISSLLPYHGTFISDVEVKEEYRRQGIMYNKLHKLITKDKRKTYYLIVSKQNMPAINLYIKLGFKMIEKYGNIYKCSDHYLMKYKHK